MDKNKALLLVRQYVKNENSIKHMIAVGAVMRALAEKFGENKDLWELAGILHDIDMEIVDYRNNPDYHGKKGAEILKENGAKEEIIAAALAHNKDTGKERNTLLEKSIYATDPLTGLIVASVLVLPEKKIADLTSKSVLKRYKEKAFAKGADRDIIATCSEIGLDLEEFINIGLTSMQEISDEIDL